jgi:RNA ligase (TIGR02306 family)
MRKMATIRKIDAINPIEGADAIEVATVGGWKVVVKKGEFKVGDLAVYCEIDSWIPTEIAPFLSKGKEPREFEGVKGERLRTVKLKGQISQGLLLPIGITYLLSGILRRNNSTQKMSDDYRNYPDEYFEEGFDCSELLNIRKWEMPVPAQLAGEVQGAFPSVIPKTDQERCQNLVREIDDAIAAETIFEVTEKLEGSSMTCYLIDGVFGVCSRNLDLKRNEKNAFWATAIKQDIETKMRAHGGNWFAIQGELIGPGIQGNIYGLKEVDFFVFDVYNLLTGTYLNPADRRQMVESMGLKHVPVIYDRYMNDRFVDGLLKMAEGKSVLNPSTEREGIVFKEVNGGFSFKAISNRYLLGEK